MLIVVLLSHVLWQVDVTIIKFLSGQDMSPVSKDKDKVFAEPYPFLLSHFRTTVFSSVRKIVEASIIFLFLVANKSTVVANRADSTSLFALAVTLSPSKHKMHGILSPPCTKSFGNHLEPDIHLASYCALFSQKEVANGWNLSWTVILVSPLITAPTKGSNVLPVSLLQGNSTTAVQMSL